MCGVWRGRTSVPFLTLMLLVANFANRKWCKKNETLVYGYSPESTQWELSNEYQHDRVKMFLNICVIVLSTKVVLALEGLIFGSYLRDVCLGDLLPVVSLSITRVNAEFHYIRYWFLIFARQEFGCDVKLGVAPVAVGHSAVPLYAGPVRAIQDHCESRSPGHSATSSGHTVRRDLHSGQRHACKKHTCVSCITCYDMGERRYLPYPIYCLHDFHRYIGNLIFTLMCQIPGYSVSNDLKISTYTHLMLK